MMDWADDIAFGDLSGCNGEMCGHDGHKVAAALRAAERRGRVAGLREAAEQSRKAAEFVKSMPAKLVFVTAKEYASGLALDIADGCSALADRIEKGE
jgi:hypothetical protein